MSCLVCRLMGKTERATLKFDAQPRRNAERVKSLDKLYF